MLSAIVITLNEEQMINDCLVSVEFADEIILVDTGNIDKTNEIAKKYNCKIVTAKPGSGWNNYRNAGIKAAKGDWILFVDADERVTPLLKIEVEQIVFSDSQFSAYEIPRRNFYLGKEMFHGGWGQDKVIRLFKKEALVGYKNKLHEQPVINGELSTMNHELIHFSHRDLESMLDKTLLFTGFESRSRLDAKHPPMAVWRFARVMFTEFWLRFVKLSAWRDGIEGTIDGLFQVFNMFIIYARLWELQQKEH